jgi:phenylacetic acid degradation operon negative regulatory protein
MKTPTFNLGSYQEKLLLLLLTGLALGCSFSPNQSFRVLKLFGRGWKEIEQKNLTRSLKKLEQQKLLIMKRRGAYMMPVLTSSGKERAHMAQLKRLEIVRPKKWDKKWRIVLFDIPEEQRKWRNILRSQLKRLQFHELQKSVFVHPFDCMKEMKQLSEYYQGEKHIRFIEATHIDNESELRKQFKI